MKGQNNWGCINGVISVAFVIASFFCSFFPGLAGTAIIFLILAIIAAWFAVLNQL